MKHSTDVIEFEHESHTQLKIIGKRLKKLNYRLLYARWLVWSQSSYTIFKIVTVDEEIGYGIFDLFILKFFSVIRIKFH